VTTMGTRATQMGEQRRGDQADLAEFKRWLKAALGQFSSAARSERLDDACAILAETAEGMVRAGLSRLVASQKHALGRMARRLRSAAPAQWAWLLCAVGNALTDCGEFEEALDTLRDMLSMGRKLDDQQIESTALQNLGIASFRMGDLKGAKRYYRRSLALKAIIGDDRGLAQVQNNLACMATEDGDLEEASRLLKESLGTKRRLHDQHGMIAAYGSLGNLAVASGDYKGARTHFARGLSFARRYGNAEELCLAYLNLGNALSELGDMESALSRYTEGMTLARGSGLAQVEEQLRRAMAVACATAGRHTEARERFLALAKLEKKLGSQFDEAMAYHDAGVMSARAEEAGEAVKYYRMAIRRFELAGDSEWHGRTLWAMGAAFASLGRLDACRTSVDRAIRILQKSNKVTALTEAYAACVPILFSTGHLDWVHSLFDRERRFLKRRGTTRELARRTWAVALLYTDHNAPRRAVSLLRQASNMYKQMRERSLEALTRADLALARAEAGQLAQAQSDYEALVELGRKTHNRVLSSQVLSNLAEIVRRRGDAENAVALGLKSITLARELRDTRSMPMLLNNLGLAHMDGDDAKSARSCFRESLKCARRLSDTDGEARALSSLGSLDVIKRRYQVALSFYDAAASALEQKAQSLGLAILMNRLLCLIELGREADASATATEAVALAQKLNDYAAGQDIMRQVASANLLAGNVNAAAEAMVGGLYFALMQSERRAGRAIAEWAGLLVNVGDTPYDAGKLYDALLRALQHTAPRAGNRIRRVLDKVIPEIVRRRASRPRRSAATPDSSPELTTSTPTPAPRKPPWPSSPA